LFVLPFYLFGVLTYGSNDNAGMINFELKQFRILMHPKRNDLGEFETEVIF
jgi:hypothetical protein